MPRIPQSQAGALSGLLDVANPVAGFMPVSSIDRPLASLLERFASRLPRQVQETLLPVYARRLPLEGLSGSHMGYLDNPTRLLDIWAPPEVPFAAAHELGHANQLANPRFNQVGERVYNAIQKMPVKSRQKLHSAFGLPSMDDSLYGGAGEILADAFASNLTGQHRGQLFPLLHKLGFPENEILRAQFAERMATSPSGRKFTDFVRRRAGILTGE